jgi:imidazolonepropionase
MLVQGTTTVEAKSGYGLDLDTEMKMLKACASLITWTYLGAHSVPKGSTAADYTQEILLRQLPTLKVRRAFPGVLSVRSLLFAPM